MALDFTVKDVIHKITAKFVHAFLPDAKKKFHLKAVLQPELDIHGIASKAEVYNIATSPKIIEEGMLSGMELIYYLAADGFKIKTPVFNLGIRLPGEYDGSEIHLPEGIHPEVRLQVNANLRAFIKEKVEVLFDGIDTSDGFIGEVRDEKTGLTDQTITIDNLLTIHGYGLKIESDPAHSAGVGVFFEAPGQPAIPAKAIAVNEPRLLKVIAPATLSAGSDYQIRVATQSSAKGSSTLLKTIREISSESVFTAQT
jgi:hypothetical protein